MRLVTYDDKSVQMTIFESVSVWGDVWGGVVVGGVAAKAHIDGGPYCP